MQDGGHDRDTAALAAERRERAAARWNLDRGVVLVPAGLMLPIAGTDQVHEYHAHPEHRYLAGVGQAGGVLAFDAGEGWTLFVPQPEAAERVWTGDGASLAGIAEVAGLERVRSASELGGWLERRRGEPLAVIGNDDITLRAAEYGVESWASLEFATDEEEGGAPSHRCGGAASGEGRGRAHADAEGGGGHASGAHGGAAQGASGHVGARPADRDRG